MFIHWGHVSQRGWEISWPLVGGNVTLPYCQDASVEAYHGSARTFCPQSQSSRAWLELGRRAGMRYAVMVAKHCDGFAMYHTRHSDFSIENTPYRADVVREYVDAARDLGLRVGLYFSLSDWHHPDYPAFTDADRPYRFTGYPRPSSEAWARYVQFMHGQVRELLTGYGKIDLIWFDGGWERTKEEWRAEELYDMVRSLQPDILINDRLPGFADFETPEKFVPSQPPSRRWETCLTMNESWAYNPSDPDYKTSRELVHTLCEVAGRGGNLLLNVSPMASGQLPDEQIERMEAIASWMGPCKESIIETEPGLEPWQFYGPSTRKGNRIFLHLLMRPYESVTARGVFVRRVRSVRDLRSGKALAYQTRCSILDQLLNSDPPGDLIIEVPQELIDGLATVIEVEFAQASA
jgi:alpha-L-fucosidase